MTETIELTDSLEAEFEKGLKRYQNGEDPASLIPLFKEIADQAPKNPTVWSCLAWLYLLTDKPEAALKAAQKSIKVDKTHPQARVNLAICRRAPSVPRPGEVNWSNALKNWNSPWLLVSTRRPTICRA